MEKQELINLGFKKDKLISGEETGKWKMPWGGAIKIENHETLHDILLRAYNIGKTMGILKGKQLGNEETRNDIKRLLGI